MQESRVICGVPAYKMWCVCLWNVVYLLMKCDISAYRMIMMTCNGIVCNVALKIPVALTFDLFSACRHMNSWFLVTMISQLWHIVSLS